jgi:hypothetical protein
MGNPPSEFPEENVSKGKTLPRTPCIGVGI